MTAKVNPTEKEVLAFATAASKGNNAAVTKFLGRYDTAVDVKAAFNRTALMYAAMLGHKTTVALLLEKGASPDETDNSNSTPLMYAAENGHKDVVELLLKSGASLDNKDWHGKTSMDKSKGEMAALLKEWSEKQRQRHEQWLQETDCSNGLKKPLPALRPLKIPSITKN